MTDRKPPKVGKQGKKKKRVAAKAGQNYDVKLEHQGRPLKLKDDGTSYAGVVLSEKKDAAEKWKWRFRYEGEDQVGYAATPLDFESTIET